jgi:hypothetical protein
LSNALSRSRGRKMYVNVLPPDTFIFRNGDGHDTFTYFVVGQDRVDLAVGIDEAALQTLITAATGNTLDLGYGNILTFSNIMSVNNTLHLSDFLVH